METAQWILLGVIAYLIIGLSTAVILNYVNGYTTELGDAEIREVWFAIGLWPLALLYFIIWVPSFIVNKHGKRLKEKLDKQKTGELTKQELLNKIKQLEKDLAEALLTK